jgi:hypothetical protein
MYVTGMEQLCFIPSRSQLYSDVEFVVARKHMPSFQLHMEISDVTATARPHEKNYQEMIPRKKGQVCHLNDLKQQASK